MNDQVLVNTELTIGGDVLESDLDGFIIKLSLVYDNPENKKRDMNLFKKIIKNEIASLNNAPLILKLQTVNGGVSSDFLLYCKFHNIKVHINTAPFIAANGEYNNEALTILSDKLNQVDVVPLNGQGEPTTVVKDVFTVIDDIFNAYENTPLEEDPLNINDQGIAGDISRRRLAGEPLRKILTDILKAQIDYSIPEVPPFKIIKGK